MKGMTCLSPPRSSHYMGLWREANPTCASHPLALSLLHRHVFRAPTTLLDAPLDVNTTSYDTMLDEPLDLEATSHAFVVVESFGSPTHDGDYVSNPMHGCIGTSKSSILAPYILMENQVYIFSLENLVILFIHKETLLILDMEESPKYKQLGESLGKKIKLIIPQAHKKSLTYPSVIFKYARRVSFNWYMAKVESHNEVSNKFFEDPKSKGFFSNLILQDHKQNIGAYVNVITSISSALDVLLDGEDTTMFKIFAKSDNGSNLKQEYLHFYLKV